MKSLLRLVQRTREVVQAGGSKFERFSVSRERTFTGKHVSEQEKATPWGSPSPALLFGMHPAYFAGRNVHLAWSEWKPPLQ
jgi:hypothetical protein